MGALSVHEAPVMSLRFLPEQLYGLCKGHCGLVLQMHLLQMCPSTADAHEGLLSNL